MASLKMKGDLAELKVATDLLERGYKIAIPYGEDWDFDLIFSRDDSLERVQVKHASSNGAFISVKCFSHSLTKGHVRATKLYTAAMIDWLAVYDATTEQCYYIPAEELADGRRQLILRLTAPRNNQRARIRFASDYLHPVPRHQFLMMEPAGLEPATSCLQGRRSPN
jgi:hypothetical protein